MKERKFYNKTYVITSIFAIIILYFASSIAPVIHAHEDIDLFREKQINISNMIDENKLNIFKDIMTIYTYENCYINDELDRFFSSNSPINTKESYYMLNCILHDIMCINTREIKEFRENYNRFNFSYLEKLFSFDYSNFFYNYNKNIKLENTESSDFNDYWGLYVNTTNYFTGNIAYNKHKLYERVINTLESWQADNYYTWLKNVNTGVEALWADFYVGLIISLVLTVISFSFDVGVVSPVIWGICSFHAVKCAAGMGYIINGIQNFKKVQEHEINIILNIENDEGEGIDYLHENFGIKAWNVDAYEKCNRHPGEGFEGEKFTYYLGEIKGEGSGKGYYALSSRDEPKYQKAPCPPGTWKIRINGNDEYKSQTIEIFDIPSAETVIHNVVLEKRN